jgi:hydroxylaminobenzene mutase
MLVFLFGLLVGLVVPTFAVPRLGLSTHLLGLMQGTFLMVAEVLWPRLRLTRLTARIGFFLAVYGCFAAWTANRGPDRGSRMQRRCNRSVRRIPVSKRGCE